MTEHKKKCSYSHPHFFDPSETVACPHDYSSITYDKETREGKHYCVFHEPKEKNKDKFWERFEEYFESIREKAAEASEEDTEKLVLDCHGFVFPDTDRFFERVFPSAVDFREATLSKEAVFWKARFEGKADFSKAHFEGKANFQQVAFKGDASFSRAEFFEGADFRFATFFKDTNISVAIFSKRAYFWHAKFENDARFYSTIFKREAYFADSVFEGEAHFLDTIFKSVVVLKNISVEGVLIIQETEFPEKANFRNLQFISIDDVLVKSAVILDDCYFHQPNRVSFGGRETDLSRFSFANTDVSQVRFIEANWKDELDGRICTLDERISRGDEKVKNLDVSFEEAEAVYRDLRRNFENKLAYSFAGDFHYGEMECRRRRKAQALKEDRDRRESDNSKKTSFWNRFRRRTELSVLFPGYKLIAGYGERIFRPLLWLLAIVVIFSFISLFIGIPSTNDGVIRWEFNLSLPITIPDSWFSDPWTAFGYNIEFMVSLGTHSVSNRCLAFILNIERIITVVLITFFVLALRRRFKR